MDLTAAIRAVARDVPEDAIAGLDAAQRAIKPTKALSTALRAAHLIGQCAHESAGFTRRVEMLGYRSTERLHAVFPRHFTSPDQARDYVRNPRALANLVYGSRMGNGSTASGDGYHYRGRGWLQLTGRANYARMGARLGLDLETRPERAAEPAIAWRIAAEYFATRRSAGRTALEWADRDNVERVTRIVNGGLHGLAERRLLTTRALAALRHTGPPAIGRGDEGNQVLILQTLLLRRGFSPGALDGDFGPRTESALRYFQKAMRLAETGAAGPRDWQVLKTGIDEPNGGAPLAADAGRDNARAAGWPSQSA